MCKKTKVVFFLFVVLLLSSCNQSGESFVITSTNQDENQPEESIDNATILSENKAKVLKVNTNLEVKHGWHIVPDTDSTLILSAEVENVDTVLFWIAETGTGTWGERTLIGYDIDGRDGWSIEWDFGDRIFHDHIVFQALGSDGSTQAMESINVHSDVESDEE